MLSFEGQKFLGTQAVSAAGGRPRGPAGELASCRACRGPACWPTGRGCSGMPPAWCNWAPRRVLQPARVQTPCSNRLQPPLQRLLLSCALHASSLARLRPVPLCCKQIMGKLTSLPFQQCKHHISSLDAQPSLSSGVLVFVTGQLLVRAHRLAGPQGAGSGGGRTSWGVAMAQRPASSPRPRPARAGAGTDVPHPCPHPCPRSPRARPTRSSSARTFHLAPVGGSYVVTNGATCRGWCARAGQDGWWPDRCCGDRVCCLAPLCSSSLVPTHCTSVPPTLRPRPLPPQLRVNTEGLHLGPQGDAHRPACLQRALRRAGVAPASGRRRRPLCEPRASASRCVPHCRREPLALPTKCYSC